MTELSVASANLHWGYGYSGARTAGVRFDLEAALCRLDADVVCLTECFHADGRPAPAELLAGLGYEVAMVRCCRFTGEPFDGRPSEPGWLQLILASRHPLRAWRTVFVGHVPGDPVGPRHALVAEVDTGPAPLIVAAFHASAQLVRGGPQRHLLGLMGRLGEVDGPAVIAGDFNFWGPPTLGLMRWASDRRLRGGSWRPAVKGRTWPAHRPHSQIDHIMVNPAVAVREGRVLTANGSDHRPVRAVLTV